VGNRGANETLRHTTMDRSKQTDTSIGFDQNTPNSSITDNTVQTNLLGLAVTGDKSIQYPQLTLSEFAE